MLILRSSDALTCVIQYTHTRLGDQSLAVAGPHLWYSLLTEFHHPIISRGHFRRALKTHLFLNWVRRLVTLAFSTPLKREKLLKQDIYRPDAFPIIQATQQVKHSMMMRRYS